MRRHLSIAAQVTFLVGLLIAACTVPERTIQIDQEPGVGSMLTMCSGGTDPCSACVVKNCGTTCSACTADSACVGFADCVQKCKTVNTACLDNCGSNFPAGDKWNALIGCSVQSCSADCSSGGTTGSAGGTGMGGSAEGSGAGGSAAPACTANGQTCAKNGDCCSFTKGGLCVDFGSGHVCADGCTANSGCQSGCCAALASGASACGPASACSTSGQGIGDGCTSNSQCKSGNCSSTTAGWCTKSCAYSIPDCNGDYPQSTFMWNKYGHPNWCLTNAAGMNSCFPGCTSSTNCTPYPGTTCKPATTTAGTDVSACAR